MGLTQLIFAIDKFCKPKITQFRIPILKDQNVLSLQVPIEYVLTVQVLQPQNGASSNELNTFITQLLKCFFPSLHGDKASHVSSFCALHDKIEEVLVCECVSEASNERMLHFGKDFPLQLNTSYCFLIHHFLSWNALHCISYLHSLLHLRFQTNLQHNTKTSFSILPQELKISKADLLRLQIGLLSFFYEGINIVKFLIFRYELIGRRLFYHLLHQYFLKTSFF